jgi:hypothetical protein
VYELKDSNWIDRGTGQCKGVYDDSQDLAMIIVETEDPPGEKEGEGGFLREDNLLLRTKVEKEEIYSRQQGIYILDLCYRSADIIVTDTLIETPAASSSTSPVSVSPMLDVSVPQSDLMTETKKEWLPVTLANVR